MTRRSRGMRARPMWCAASAPSRRRARRSANRGSPSCVALGACPTRHAPRGQSRRSPIRRPREGAPRTARPSAPNRRRIVPLPRRLRSPRAGACHPRSTLAVPRAPVTRPLGGARRRGFEDRAPARASTEMGEQCASDGRLVVAIQCAQPHDDAGGAEAALTRAGCGERVDPSRTRRVIEAFERRHVASREPPRLA